jgi:hypothetical protein
MKTSPRALLALALIAAPLGLLAQTTNPGSPARGTTADSNDRPTRYAAESDVSEWGPRMGDREFTLGGSGLSNKDLDDTSGGVNASLGWYMSDTLEFVVRQNIAYVNSDTGSSTWAGSTRIALDQHVLARGPIRPFIGVNFGGVYGDDTNDTWVAGLEGGAKFYMQPRTFLFALVDYGWAFDDADEADDNFDDGGFTWTLGIGFNF